MRSGDTRPLFLHGDNQLHLILATLLHGAHGQPADTLSFLAATAKHTGHAASDYIFERLIFQRSRQAAEAALAFLSIASGLSMGRQAEQGKQEGRVEQVSQESHLQTLSDKYFQQHPRNQLPMSGLDPGSGGQVAEDTD